MLEMQPLLSCAEKIYNKLVIPAFTINAEEIVGVTIPTPFSDTWINIMKLLSGDISNPGIIINAKTFLLTHSFLINNYAAKSTRQTVLDVLIERTGISHFVATQFLAELQIESDDLLVRQGMNQKTLIGIAEAWCDNAELIILSTSGLDPKGINTLLQIVNRNTKRCSVIDIFSSQTVDFFKSINQENVLFQYDKIVHCLQFD